MTTPGSIDQRGASIARDWIGAALYYLASRRGILVVAAIAIVAGTALNWDWLVAAGLAPILLTVLPCLVMCGLGICLHRFFGDSSAPEKTRPTAAMDRIDGPSGQPERAPSLKSSSACCGDTTPPAPGDKK